MESRKFPATLTGSGKERADGPRESRAPAPYSIPVFRQLLPLPEVGDGPSLSRERVVDGGYLLRNLYRMHPTETEVTPCPACRHLVRVPIDWLGQSVQCPECQARFRAPTRGESGLTAPVLLSGPPGAGPAARPKADLMLTLPAFGLMFVGLASLAVNGVKSFEYLTRPGAAEQDVLTLTEQARQRGYVADGPEQPDEQQRFDQARAADYAQKIRILMPAFTVVGGLVFYGGLAIVLRRHFRMAQLGCALAVFNFANGCCIPGAVFGVWGLLMLMSEEGRGHFVDGASG